MSMPLPQRADAAGAGAPPLVSVAMPAFKAHYLQAALDSVRAQTWPHLELVVCDDSQDQQVQALVEAFAADAAFPVRYHRNAERLHESRNGARCVQLARGEYVKFLYDDDLLHPDCIAAQVAAIHGRPEIALVSARRQRIHASGFNLPDTVHTARLFERDVLIDGPELVGFLGNHTVNFIGEPSSVLCRRADLLAFGDRLMDLGGVPIRWFGDLALYAKLLRHGGLAFLDRRLSSFRVSNQQFSHIGRNRPGIGDKGRDDFRRSLRELGWCSDDPELARVAIAGLWSGEAPAAFDLAAALLGADATARIQQQLHEWRRPRRWRAAQRALAERHLAQSGRARLGVVVSATPDTPREALATTLDSLVVHAAHLELQVAVVGAALPADKAWPATAQLDADAGSALRRMATDGSDWLLQVEAGTFFCVGGMQRLALELPGLQACRAVYADGWHADADGNTTPLLLPEPDPDLLLGNPRVMGRHWIFHRQAVLDARHQEPAASALPGFTLALDVIARNGAGAVHHLAEPLVASAPAAGDEAGERRAILDHLRILGHARAEVGSAGPGLHRIRYGHARQPKVSLVICARGDPAPLQRCVLSVLEKTAWPDYELLLVDNGLDPGGQHWLEEVERLAGGRVRAFVLDQPQPHPAACNLAAGQASGEFLLFLSAEAAVLQPEWLHELMDHGLRADVGVTGARTVDADGRIRHAGLVPALAAGDGRAFAGEPLDAPGYLGRLRVAQRYSAVSDSCLLIGSALFGELGGFDAAAFPGQGADIDLCLRAAAAGRTTIWTPHALLLHTPVAPAPAESVAARDALCERWLPQLARDPAYHPGLRLDVPGGFRLGETDFSWRPLPWRPLPRLLVQPADPWGSGQYRVIQPFEALKTAGLAEGACYAPLLDPVELARIDPDVVVMQRRVGEEAIARIERMRRFSRAFRVHELDDWLPGLPLKSAHRAEMPKDITASLRQVLSRVDRLVVATPALAEAFAGFHERIRVVENRLDPRLWKALPAARARPGGGKPRVGWAGGIGHTGDLEMIADVVRELAGEVDWVFFGMCPERLRPYVAEFHEGISFHAYPRALARLGLDLALAPLEDNRFNQCKSQLRLLEYGACGYPVVCSDIAPYRGGLPVTRVRNRFRDWVGAIRGHLAEREATAAAGQALRQAVLQDWMLEGRALEDWRKAWLPD